MSQADDCAIVPTAFVDARAIGADEGRVAALVHFCRAMAHAQPAALLPRGTHLALRAMADLLVAKGSAELKNGINLDHHLLMVLPYYSQQLYQDAQSRFQNLSKSAVKPDLTAALLRPNCIEHPSGLNCYGLPQNPEMLRGAFSKELERCAEAPGSGAPEGCRLRIDDAAVSVAIASEYLIPFIQDQMAHAPRLSQSCVNGSDAFRCFQALLATVERAAEMFMGQKELAGALDYYSRQSGLEKLANILPASSDFIAHWTSNVPDVLRNPSEIHGIFFLAPDVFSWISDNAPSYQRVVAQIRDDMNAERLAVAKLGRAYLDELVADAVSQREQLAANFPNDIKDIDLIIDKWKTESQKFLEYEPEVLIVKVSRMAENVLGIEQKVLFVKSKIAKQLSRECMNSAKGFSKSGVFEVCFDEMSREFGAAGFRFSFVPCTSPSRNCDIVGHLDLLLKLRKTENDSHSLIPIALGVTNLHGTILADSETLHVLRPPAPAYNLDIRQMEQSVGSLLQYPFQLKLDSEQVEIADGPIVIMTVRPTFSLPGMPPLAPFRVSMGPAGLKVADDLAPTLRAAVIKQIGFALQYRQIAVAGLKVKLDAGGFERAAGCDAVNGGTAVNLEGEADLRPAFGYAPRVSLNISCNGQMQLALSNGSAQAILNEILAKGRQVLPVKAAAVGAVVDGTKIQFGLEIVEGCSKILTIDLATSNILESANGEIATAVASCAAITAARRASSNIPPFADLPLQSDGDRACTADLPVLGRICLSPLKNIGNARLGQIHVESDGKFISAVRKQLGFASPIVDALQLRDGPRLVLPLRVTIPGLTEPVSTELPVTGNMNLADALNSSLAAAIDAKLRGKRARVGPVEVNVIRVNGDAGGLFVTGQVYYGELGAGIRIRLIPSLSVSADAPGDREITELIASLGMRVLGSPPIEVSIGPDGVPILHWPVRLKVPLFDSGGFEASTIVNARANGKLRLGSVGVTVPGWLTVGYFAIGRATIQVDLDHPENVALGALLTIAPGEGVSELARLRGNLRHDANRKRVEIDGDLALASIPLGKSDGYWDYQKGVLDLQAGSATDGLPFPRGRLEAVRDSG
ncbi:hypothetical protein JHL17_04440 [Azospirillum sp. YIM B02556]|uniref:Uncharacterized protein n=1 Tax=Azospirillum endophyticum TaxID=2800326 RepID=A0ABS1EZU6_9PROT|nr:hypothetical protein [Azospirillum endophyticum]MBK1836653.1 hypothetical protein [Azospirillum endophyticum]